MRVGFVGATGMMGHGMATNIVKAGHELALTLRRDADSRVDDLFALGARRAASHTELGATCDVVVLCITSSRDVEDVVAGADGLLTEPREGLVIVDASTSEPEVTRRLAALARSRGVGFVDAPLTRGPREAAAGRLNSLVGGEDADVEVALPVISTYSENILRTGASGTAHTLKLLNNTVIQCFCGVMGEAFGVAAAAGLDPHLLVEILSKGNMNSKNLETMGRALDGDFEGMKFAIDNARKDVRYYMRMAGDLGYVSPLGDATHETLSMASKMGLGGEHISAGVKAQERLNGVTIVTPTAR